MASKISARWRAIGIQGPSSRSLLPSVTLRAFLNLLWAGWFSFVALCLGVPQTKDAPAEERLDEGVKLFEQGRFSDAIEVFNRFKQTAPEDPRPYFYSGMALSGLGRLSGAALELQEAVRLAPAKPEYLIFQANVLARLKQKTEALNALATFEKESQPKQLDNSWLKLLAEVYLRVEKFEDALRMLALSSQRAPDDASIDFDRGKVYIVVGRTDFALAAFRKSIEKSSNNPATYFELGKLLQQRNEFEAAKKALLEAVKRDETNPEYLFKLALVCLSHGEAEEALGYLKRAEPSAPDFPGIYFALGRAYQLMGDRAKGEAYRMKFQEASNAQREKEDRERVADRFIAQGERQLDAGNTSEARALFEQAVQTDPNRWDPHGYLAEMFVSSGDLDLANPHLVKMEEIDPESVVGNYLMARYWFQRKELERARTYAEKVMASRPGNPELRNLLGNIYLGLGQSERALQEYKTAVRLAPNRADFREQLQRALKDMPAPHRKAQGP